MKAGPLDAKDGQDLIIQETEITRKLEGIRILQLVRIPQLRGEGERGKKLIYHFVVKLIIGEK